VRTTSPHFPAKRRIGPHDQHFRWRGYPADRTLPFTGGAFGNDAQFREWDPGGLVDDWSPSCKSHDLAVESSELAEYGVEVMRPFSRLVDGLVLSEEGTSRPSRGVFTNPRPSVKPAPCGHWSGVHCRGPAGLRSCVQVGHFAQDVHGHLEQRDLAIKRRSPGLRIPRRSSEDLPRPTRRRTNTLLPLADTHIRYEIGRDLLPATVYLMPLDRDGLQGEIHQFPLNRT